MPRHRWSTPHCNIEPLQAFLDTTGALDNAAWATMVADARDKLATFAPIPNGSIILDQRQALATIGNTLDDLLVEQASPVRC